ncbi:hypothetical protein [Desulfonema magnum]|uniref:Uncharacterized protein n=1 Tax=Desulfonema magnum TaxID=45655 RepID=A0A975BSL5_9BACT|nr:hypothetical protein [Desulfonema magnum]QTA90916.1 Uncharacterized protein dnm_069780 [Desulfonema magnum]
MLSCLIAKIHKPEVDIRKPYTEIGGDNTYSGKFYDENCVESFVAKHKLPCNSTTAFLTPAFRNIDRLLTTDLVMVGKPRQIYVNTLELLDNVFQKEILPEDLAKEILRFLFIIKNENEERMNRLIADHLLSSSVVSSLNILKSFIAGKQAQNISIKLFQSVMEISFRISGELMTHEF